MEPQAYGHIVFKTTFGNLELELFVKQCPKLSRNFVQLCLDGYYEGTIFNRIDKDFIAVGGIRPDEDHGDDQLQDQLERCKDEFHSRLRFTRRGLLATANTEKDCNKAEFFFTLGPTQELQGKHSIFGRLKGNSVYCLVDLNECQVDEDLKPLSEKKILQVEILENPFPELEIRANIASSILCRVNKASAKVESVVGPKIDFKPDKKLSFYQDEDESEDEHQEETKQIQAKNNDLNIRDKLSGEIKRDSDSEPKLDEPIVQSVEEGADAREKRLEQIRAEILNLKKQFESDSATKIETLSERRGLKRDSDNDCKQLESKIRLTTESRNSSSNKRARVGGRDTERVVENFKEKLIEVTHKLKSHNKQSKQVISHDDVGGFAYEDEDARLLAELDTLEDDTWLAHKFEPGNQHITGDSERRHTSLVPISAQGNLNSWHRDRTKRREDSDDSTRRTSSTRHDMKDHGDSHSRWQSRS